MKFVITVLIATSKIAKSQHWTKKSEKNLTWIILRNKNPQVLKHRNIKINIDTSNVWNKFKHISFTIQIGT